jgi:hypothetical protein
MIISDLYNNKKQSISEGMEEQVVFSDTGADGGTYEIIQSGPTDFMIHANGKHIDTYGSLQRAMSVLKNEVQGLQQGMAEGSIATVGWPDEGNHTGNTPPVSVGGVSMPQLRVGDQVKYFGSKATVVGLSQDRKRARIHMPERHTTQNVDTADLTRLGQGDYANKKSLPRVSEVSLGDYRKKAAVSQAGAKTDRFFGRDDPAKVAAADQTIAKRERGLARADARIKPYTPPTAAPADLEKQQRDLTAKYPNIDELVRRAELNRDPNYEMADGQAHYAARDAEQNYQKLRQIQRVIQGLNESLDRSHLP